MPVSPSPSLGSSTEGIRNEPEDEHLFFKADLGIRSYKSKICSGKKCLCSHSSVTDNQHALQTSRATLVDKDISDVLESVEMMKTSALMGNSNAQFTLGVLYFHGLRRGRPNEATQECTHGNLCWKAGETTDSFVLRKSVVDALNYFQRAAEQGHKEALCNLGNMYSGGISVTQSDSTAKKYWLAAAQPSPKLPGETSGLPGLAQAQFNLGLYAELGRGCCTELSPSSGNPLSRHSGSKHGGVLEETDGWLAFDHWWQGRWGSRQNESGKGNQAEAMYWYRLAASQGLKSANKKLTALSGSGLLPQRPEEAEEELLV